MRQETPFGRFPADGDGDGFLLCNNRLRTRLMRRRRLLKETITIAGFAALGRFPAAAAATGADAFVCTTADCDPYVYDPAIGDPDNIADPAHPVTPGTPFAALPETWRCPLCGAPKAAFARYRDLVSRELRASHGLPKGGR